MTFVIAEIGNNHEGSMQQAYAMIMQARACGVDGVKFQAGKAEGFARTTEDVPKYEKYSFILSDYISLYNYAKALGLKAFFSIWSKEYEVLRSIEDYHKIPARQCNNKTIKKYDFHNTLISIPYEYAGNRYKKRLKELKVIMKNSIPMYCISEYPTKDPCLKNIEMIKSIFDDGRPIGYSDHTIGIEACIEAVKNHGVKYIEKHFTLDKNTQGLRDHKLSANKEDMKILIKAVKSK